jgi:AcrR family transcriptional regulator
VVPKLWTETIDEHRRAVRDAALDATAALVAEHGLTSVTMSRIAEATGVGRATLYKYFPDVDAILVTWHERQVSRHLEHLQTIRSHAEPSEELTAVLTGYAHMSRQHRDSDLSALLHSRDHVAKARQELHDFVSSLLADGVRAGGIRSDIPTSELASYCLHALAAAPDLGSDAAVERLIELTLAGLRPPS